MLIFYEHCYIFSSIREVVEWDNLCIFSLMFFASRPSFRFSLESQGKKDVKIGFHAAIVEFLFPHGGILGDLPLPVEIVFHVDESVLKIKHKVKSVTSQDKKLLIVQK